MFLILYYFRLGALLGADGYQRGGIRDLLPKDLRAGLNSSRAAPGFCSQVLEIHPFPKCRVRNLSLPSIHRWKGDTSLGTQRSPEEKGKTKPTPKNSVKKTLRAVQLPVISPGLQMFPLINSTPLLECLLMISSGQKT